MMRKFLRSAEDLLFLSASLLSLVAMAAGLLLRTHAAVHNPRVHYGVEHLPGALLGVAVFAASLGVSRHWISRAPGFPDLPCAYYIAAITAVFGVCWIPAWLSGGFVADDWALLAAASIRKIIYAHPGYSWYALDSVDGNFRPLGTVLYFGFLLKWFGPAARVFTLGPLLLSLLAGLLAFAIVRELGYSKIAAAAASLLFLSRGLLYTVVTWASALGDSVAILFCGLSALLLLKATRRRGPAAFLFHALAWGSFLVATLGKQSAFVMPLIAALLLLLRPGERAATNGVAHGRDLGRRAASAAFAACLYSATTAAVFLHARELFHGPSPYPIRFSLGTLLQTFSFATWYFLVVQLPNGHGIANMAPAVLGLALVAAMCWLAWRHPALLGERPGDVVFCGLAAAASCSLFAVLGTRSAPYYGCMSAFWFSIGLGIALTRWSETRASTPAARLCGLIFYTLLLSGFTEVRLEQTALLPSGGYLWGTFGMDAEREVQADMRRQLANSADKDLLLMVDCPHAIPYGPIALLDAPAIRRILLYDSRTGSYLGNDREGLRPADSFAELRQPRSYRWSEPIGLEAARKILAEAHPLRLVCDGEKMPRQDVLPTATAGHF